MIDHSKCEHEATSRARAKCRKARRANGESGEDVSRETSTAEPRDVWMGLAHHNPDRERNRGTTPRDKDRECHICHIEVIRFRGTEATTGILRYVGERCLWRIKDAPDLQEVRP